MGKAVKKDKNSQRRKWAGVEKRKLDKRGAMALNAFSDRGSFAISAQKKRKGESCEKETQSSVGNRPGAGNVRQLLPRCIRSR